jgi:hypothetical protein
LSLDGGGATATTVSYPDTSSPPTASNSDTGTQISFDGPSRTYTVNVMNRLSSTTVPLATYTFGPGEIDQARSDAKFTIYSRTDATARQTLTVTNPGTSGAYTYQYVGSALFKNDKVTGGSARDVSFSAGIFGYATDEYVADLSLRSPTTGTARYGIDVLGYGTGTGDLVTIAGSGDMFIDFGKNAFSLDAETNGLTSSSAHLGVGGAIGREGRIPLQNLALIGDARFTEGATNLAGRLTGTMFGPGGSEVGASWTVSGSGLTVSGTVMGRKAADVSPADHFDDATNAPQFYKVANDSNVQIYYDAKRGTYRLITSTFNLIGLAAVDAVTLTGSAAFGPSDGTSVVLHKGTGTPLDWLRSTDKFLFGYATTAAAVPRAGAATYAMDINGIMRSDSGINGNATIKADLGAATFDLAGTLVATTAGTTSDNATLFGVGTIVSGYNDLNGTIDFKFAKAGPFRATLSGQFYGPTGQELGITYVGSDLSGTMIGRRTSYDPNPTVSPVSGTAYGSTGYATWLHSPALGTPANFLAASTGPSGISAPELTWNPGTAQFIVTPANPVGDPDAPFSVGAAERDAAASDADFDVYKTTQGGTAYAVRVLRADNTKIAMTYAGFAGVTARLAGTDNASTADDHDDAGFAVLDYRNVTASVPISGTGIYVGQVFGEGVQLRDNTSKAFFTLTGASQFRMDFAQSLFDGTLAISGKDVASGSVTDFGAYNWSGTIAGSGFDATGYGGALHGTFFGPAAQEVAGVFATDQTGPGTRTSLQGVFLAK